MIKPDDPYLLVVEDSDEDFEALRRILLKHCELQVSLKRCYDGDEALDLLHQTGDYAETKLNKPPNLILLDLNLPGSDGRDVLRQVKQDERLKVIPIVVLTTSSNPRDIDACYRYGANSYLVKPMDVQQLKSSVCLLLNYWFEVTQLPEPARSVTA
ncbi:response regulator [cf. Phormidesmis sp. LEGE 11477]|uniref:response regulator n=1 Tax=cf. Phormidesmis sp. LEGE 11477 TaxID=1828680 RepID=UPI00187ECCD6|nr:response regulator [cf. Phormidesmis sp. LEGE 11477]MBE9061142.1 response regulator [cf. Phormidesmis sp. LEGE 11477]